MKKIMMMLALAGLTAFTANAQKMKKVEGSVDPLKGEEVLKIEFRYDDMEVGKNLTEEEYIERKVEEYNKKEAGTGDKWRESWVRDREARFEPKFFELFNKNTEKIGLEGIKEGSANYTLIVHTYYTEPGFNVGVMRRPAFINVKYTIVKSGSSDVVAEYDQQKVPGADAMGYDFDTGSRIAESYAKAGKEFGKLLTKELK